MCKARWRICSDESNEGYNVRREDRLYTFQISDECSARICVVWRKYWKGILNHPSNKLQLESIDSSGIGNDRSKIALVTTRVIVLVVWIKKLNWGRRKLECEYIVWEEGISDNLKKLNEGVLKIVDYQVEGNRNYCVENNRKSESDDKKWVETTDISTDRTRGYSMDR